MSDQGLTRAPRGTLVQRLGEPRINRDGLRSVADKERLACRLGSCDQGTPAVAARCTSALPRRRVRHRRGVPSAQARAKPP